MGFKIKRPFKMLSRLPIKQIALSTIKKSSLTSYKTNIALSGKIFKTASYKEKNNYRIYGIRG